MPTITKFTDIQAWQKAHLLVLTIYKATRNFPKDEIFVLVSQMKRAALSVPANIVEGFYRKTPRDTLRFYEISASSLEELKYYVLVSKDLNYITLEQTQILTQLCDEVGRLLYGWKKILQ